MLGELTLVVGGASAPSEAASDTDLAADVATREAAGASRKDAIADVARARGVPKRAVFDAVVAAKPTAGVAVRTGRLTLRH